MNRQSGVTLIELMIIVVIIGILAVAAIPLTNNWIDESRVSQGKALLLKAHAQAKALGQRNPEGVMGDEPAAGFKLLTDDSLILVCSGNTGHAECAAGGSRVIWQAPWPKEVTSSVTEGRVNNRGQILVGGSSINTGVTFIISNKKGDVTDEDDEYNVLR